MKKQIKKTSVKKIAKKTVKKAPAKKAAAKKSPAKKPAAKKAVTKKASAKKAPVKKQVPQKGKTKKGKEDLMCFLTTACVHHYGLADNCYELETLRHYRDSYLMQQESGKALVSDYYALAPNIVKTISSHPTKEKYYSYIYNRVQDSCRAIENKQLEKARRIYQTMVLHLKGQLL